MAWRLQWRVGRSEMGRRTSAQAYTISYARQGDLHATLLRHRVSVLANKKEEESSFCKFWTTLQCRRMVCETQTGHYFMPHIKYSNNYLELSTAKKKEIREAFPTAAAINLLLYFSGDIQTRYLFHPDAVWDTIAERQLILGVIHYDVQKSNIFSYRFYLLAIPN